MYVCGPTVYDVPHIGHARSAYVFDVIRRHLVHSGYDVFFVRNVTDVDDKIIKKAAEELKEINGEVMSWQLRERVTEVATRYLGVYHRQMDILGIIPPTREPRATENIGRMIEFIKSLIEKGYAYAAGGDVYFEVEKFAPYGKLSKQNKDEMMHGVRIEPDSKKKSALDFALWKQAKEGEPAWKSPWGEGRPGWHIECSAMSTDLLGENFDIHGGGLDLVFPHHENEVAQAEAATGKPFANYWIHNGLLFVNGVKMSKSLGNFITIEDFLKKHKDPDLIKLIFIASHYRSPMDYTDGKIEEARHAKERIMIFLDRADRLLNGPLALAKGTTPEELGSAHKVVASVLELKAKFDAAMDDDFNTPTALSVIFDAVHAGNDLLSDGKNNETEKVCAAGAVKNLILKCADILGLALKPVKPDEEETLEIKSLVEERERARRNKDFAESDRIRKLLASKGIVVEDTPGGSVWRKS